MKILIAEDDDISRRMLEASLVKKGYDVVTTSDGKQAWEVMRKDDAPQMAILDWMMPEMDGVEVCRKVRAKKKRSYTYIIMLTAKGSSDDIAEALNAGSDDYIRKPFSAKELHARINVGRRILDLQNRLEKTVKRLREYDKLKSDFLSMVSHELRTPIAVMRGGVSLCLDGIAGEINETQREILKDTLDNIDRLGRLVTDLLDVSKIEAGKVIMRRDSHDICKIVRKIHSSYLHEAEEKGIKLVSDLPKKEVKAYVDGDKVTQIFTNLVSNALRYTKEGGTVTIKVEDKEEEILCSVSDTGVGISKENIPKLFSKFEQFGRVEGPGYKGTGLGLTIAKGLVERHGGKIWVDSEVGKGTTFWFTLKKVEYPKILIVDDEQNMIDIIEKFLKEGDYRFIRSGDGIGAVELARNESPSLIVLDMMLPGMNGYEVIGRLKQDMRTKDIPIIITSAYEVDEDRLKSTNGNAAIPVLKKPVEPEDLQYKVKELLSVETK